MDALGEAGEHDEALALLKSMKSPGSGCNPDKRTYTAAIKAMIKKVSGWSIYLDCLTHQHPHTDTHLYWSQYGEPVEVSKMGWP